ncbi:YfbR-like 5'-deoxynucleotidase [Pseudovibrio sp. JE062]|uniref:YfbR-like 5'-deoxynucleotidase n=1 Tax=Pseudovibrio sp. JE062 TaxID=439495 RepID=UPI000186C675|nr:HD family hydrolase [Pseudovibrio sp. JE062]EEA94225.1 metal dependent phosphohydrolase [Pseudovibrio sp. JE062]
MCAELSSSSPRAWQRMLSGRRLNLLDPSPLDVELSDIAHGLARVARWNGQTIGDHAFSVAQHCVVVEEIALMLKPDLDIQWRMAILLHDAPEYVIGDMISPFKNVMGGTYKAVEERLHHAIHRAFDLPADLPASIAKLAKKADIISAYLEAIHLAGFSKEEADKIFGKPAKVSAAQLDVLAESITPLPTKDAQEAFLARFAELNEARKAVGGR